VAKAWSLKLTSLYCSSKEEAKTSKKALSSLFRFACSSHCECSGLAAWLFVDFSLVPRSLKRVVTLSPSKVVCTSNEKLAAFYHGARSAVWAQSAAGV